MIGDDHYAGTLLATVLLNEQPPDVRRRVAEGREIPEAHGWWDPPPDADHDQRLVAVTSRIAVTPVAGRRDREHARRSKRRWRVTR